MGGSHVAAVVCDARGKVHRSAERKCERRGGVREWVRAIVGTVDEAVRLPEGRRVRRTVGVAFPGVLEGPTGRVVYAPNLPGWLYREAVPLLEKALRSRVRVENDANCGAWAEHRLRGKRTGPDLLYVVLGTGIGAGVVLDGQLLRGRYGTAGELGHLRVPGALSRCGCGNRGCLEAVAGGRALARRAEELARERPTSALGRLRAERGALSAWDLLRVAEQKDPMAAMERDRAGWAIGEALGGAVNLLGTTAVVVSGRLPEGAPGFWRAIVSHFESTLLPPLRPRVSLRRAEDWQLRNAVGARLLMES